MADSRSWRSVCSARNLVLVGTVALASLGTTAISGCVRGGGAWFGASEKETRTSTLEHVAGSALDVKTVNGSVTIEAADRNDVQVTAKITAKTKERLEATKVLAERRSDRTLAVYIEWPDDKRRDGEGCSLEIRVPNAGGALVRTSNGSINISGVKGKTDLDTSNGSVKVAGTTGEVKIDTSNGGVTVEEATGPVHVDTSNGSVKVMMRSDASGPVKIDTSNGSVALTVGPEFAGTMRISTSNGSISLPREGSVKSATKTRGSAKVVFREGGKDSIIDTSNASVTVSVSQ